MDFWRIYQTASVSENFGEQRLYLRSKDRTHSSLSAVEAQAERIEINGGLSAKYAEGARYVIADDLTYDLLVSFYDVNSSRAVLMRMSSFPDKKSLAAIRGKVGRMRGANLELRAVGLQSGDPTMRDSLREIQGIAKCNLQEADLFGTNARHVVFDLKVGTLMDLLPLNRIFRPDELANKLSLADFGRLRSGLKFEKVGIGRALPSKNASLQHDRPGPK
jgi:hypothetical protein